MKKFLFIMKEVIKGKSPMQKYFESREEVQLNDLFEEDQIRRIEKFFFMKYNVSLFDLVKGLKLTRHIATDTVPAYGGMYLYNKNQVSIADTGYFGLFLGRINRTDREANFIHELTHVLQWRDKSFSAKVKKVKTAWANCQLIFGFSNAYAVDELENEARENQAQYTKMVEDNKEIFDQIKEVQSLIDSPRLRDLYDVTLEEAQIQIRELQERIF